MGIENEAQKSLYFLISLGGTAFEPLSGGAFPEPNVSLREIQKLLVLV